MATKNELGHVRRSQAVGTHGPGAIVDFKAGGRGATVSVVAAGLEAWDEQTRMPGLGHPQIIFEPRLQQKLGVDGFRLPPVARQLAPGVPAPFADSLVGVQFPTWLQCPDCKTIARTKYWNVDPGKVARYCGACTDASGGASQIFVVPVRFILACAKGHLDDFPWDFWVSHEPRGCRGNLQLSGGNKAGLAGLVLSCEKCGAARTMEGCFDRQALDRLGLKCAGRSPWLPKEPESDCKELPRALQRGASNLYFPFNQSALDIPPWSDSIQKRLERYWQDLVQADSAGERTTILKALKLDKKLGMTLEALAKEVEDRVKNLEAPTKDSLRHEEYRQFVERDQPFAHPEFEIRPEIVPPELRSSVERIVTATRLREVRAIVGFTRIVPPAGQDDARMAPIQLGRRNWLPAIELRGEGVFIDLNGSRLREWERRREVLERAERIDARYAKAWAERNKDVPPPRTVTPRLLLVHGVAHALMKQLALDCGYSSAALRERLYVDDTAQDMAGLLIYTATPDSEGTLGGLARQGSPAHMMRAFQAALLSLTWCSSDPLCIDGTSSLSHQLNGAACHACMLAAETSCEEFNYLLDRSLLVGTPEERGLGFFADFIEASRSGGL